jgi:hypothetical protein
VVFYEDDEEEDSDYKEKPKEMYSMSIPRTHTLSTKKSPKRKKMIL